MAKNRRTSRKLDNLPRKDKLALGQQIMDELYREGSLVKALDASGKPEFQDGLQAYKPVVFASATELAFWNLDNKVN
jgi:hypothetical protein